MRALHFFSGLCIALIGASSVIACSSNDSSPPAEEESSDLTGPGQKATDGRSPELGDDLSVVRGSKITMAAALKQIEKSNGPIIETKFELDHEGKLSLSLYPVDTLDVDAERSTFRELAGDPTRSPFGGGLETFEDQEHLTRSARDLTLVQLSSLSALDAVNQMPASSFPFWAIPTIQEGRAGYGVYYLTGQNHKKYRFVDGEGDEVTGYDVEDLGTGPGPEATDARTPEVGEDLSVLSTSKVTMAEALKGAEATYGPAIEAKFELDHSGKLSLSIYPVADITLDAERNSFKELAGDPTVSPFAGEISEFKVPDAEHLTRSARDLTLVQTAGLTLREAVAAAEKQVDGGFVYWAIPTIRGTRSGYGIYVYGKDKYVHYLFVS